LAVANTQVGFPASAVDLGRLKDALETGLAAFDMRELRRRWRVDLGDWTRRLILAWTQRCKLLKMRVRARGISVEIETQDDAGYYTYSFDVFPGRDRPKPSPRRPQRVPQ
jgi:hypothetical protein